MLIKYETRMGMLPLKSVCYNDMKKVFVELYKNNFIDLYSYKYKK